MAVLVLLEFDASGIKQPSRSAVAAAVALGEVHALVAGAGLGDAAAAAVLYLALSRWTGSRGAGMATAALFAFSPCIWRYAIDRPTRSRC